MLWGVRAGKQALLECSSLTNSEISQTQHSGKERPYFVFSFSSPCPNSHTILFNVYCDLILGRVSLKKNVNF